MEWGQIAFFWLGVAVTLLFVHLTLRGMKKQRQLESILRTLEYVHDPELRQARSFAFRQEKRLKEIFDEVTKAAGNKEWKEISGEIDEEVKKINDSTDSDSTEDRINFHQVEIALKTLDNVAFLIKKHYVPYKPLATNLMTNEFQDWARTFDLYIELRRERSRRKAGGKHIPLENLYCNNLRWLVDQIEKDELLLAARRASGVSLWAFVLRR
ncbi:hypothetical protein MYX78_06105 [Acidobacteria bacterium AH-259-G07]|nr:hypothetical protein [Acidobacteria bacterium AH-259-G07]